MFLLNSCLGLFSAARFRGHPFSRSYGVILPSSLAVLLPPASGFSPHPPVSVSGTGPDGTIAAFLGTYLAYFATFFRSASRPRLPRAVFPARRLLRLHRSFRSRLAPPRCVPAFSVRPGCRNLHLLSFGYAFRPPLRPRLTRGRSALPRKPRIFGREDSHLPLATRSGILPSCSSTVPSGTASPVSGMLPYQPASLPAPGLRRRV